MSALPIWIVHRNSDRRAFSGRCHAHRNFRYLRRNPDDHHGGDLDHYHGAGLCQLCRSGSFTVIATGGPFQAGATLIETFGTYAGIQMTTTAVTSTTITAQGYVSSADLDRSP